MYNLQLNKNTQSHCEGGIYENMHHQKINLKANIEYWININGSYMENGIIPV